ncbi:cadherin domain protein, partial [Cooperia oncophora]
MRLQMYHRGSCCPNPDVSIIYYVIVPRIHSSSVWIESGNEDNVFDLNVQRQFSILKLLKNAIDITKSEYNLVFVASDGQMPQRLSNATLKVPEDTKVYNEAKLTSSPVIVERELSVSIAEDSPVGTFVAQVHTNSSGCEFTLSGDVPFEVDRESGIITTVSTMDVNRRDNYALEILVQLPPPSIHTVTATVTVMIIDVNDHAPSFVDLPDQLSISEDTTVGSVVFTVKALDEDVNDNVPEFPCSMVHSVLPINSPPGTVVTTVHAEDRDSASAGQVHYALLDAITGFSIDSSSGVIQTTEALQDKQYT